MYQHFLTNTRRGLYQKHLIQLIQLIEQLFVVALFPGSCPRTSLGTRLLFVAANAYQIRMCVYHMYKIWQVNSQFMEIIKCIM